MKTVDQNHSTSIQARLVLNIVFLVVLGCVISVLYGAHWLRPAADDYCSAWSAGLYGVFGSVVAAWSSINGFATSGLFGNFWVGWPLIYLPYSLSSAIPFLAAALGIGLAVLFIVRTLKQQKILPSCYLVLLVSFLWWVFLWIAESFKGFIGAPITVAEQQLQLLTYGLTYWQTLNGMYVLQEVCVLIGIAILSKYVDSKALPVSVGVLCLGLFSGMTGPTLALSLILFAIAYLGYRCFTACYISLALYFNFGIFIFSTLIGLLATLFLSPGNQNRKVTIGAHYDLSILGLANAINDSFQFGMTLWIASLFSLGAFFAFIFTASYCFLSRPLVEISPVKLLHISLMLAIFALLQIIVNRFSEYFAYQGYWHFVSALVCIFISIILGGASLGLFLSQKKLLEKTQSIAILFLLATSAIAISSNYSMLKSMHERGGKWSGGAAPVLGVTDIEEPWVRACWVQVHNLRSLPLDR